MRNSPEMQSPLVSAEVRRPENKGGIIVWPENNRSDSIRTARTTIIVALLIASIVAFVVRLFYS
jgi:hypothetical protein